MARAYAVRVGSPAAQLALPRVPWEGGPAYYASYAQASASGMTSDNFFPILVDFESVLDQSNINSDKAYGVNGYYRLTDDSVLSLIRTNGMIAFPGIGIAATPGAETVGWNLEDEVDMWAGAGWNVWNGQYSGQNPGPTANCGFDIMARFSSPTGPNAPRSADGRMRHINYGKGVAFNESDADSRVFVNGSTRTASASRAPGATDGRGFTLDGVSLDFYYYTGYLSTYDRNSLDGIGCPANLLRRAINYGKFGVDRIRQRQAMESPPNYQPVYGFVEVTNQMTASETTGEGIPVSAPSDAQIAGAVWACIVYEARGIIYFVHDFQHSGNAHNLRDNIQGHTAAVATLNARITALAPVLNTQSYVWSFNATVKTMLKARAGYAYVFAMSNPQASHDTTARTFTLPAGITGTTVDVLNESRTLTVSGGTFSDSFAAEYTCHIYRIAL
jgi:hypothetical protein